MPFPPAGHDHHGHALGREIGKIGAVGVEGGRLGGDFARQNDLGLVGTEHDVFDPSKIAQPLLAVLSEPLFAKVLFTRFTPPCCGQSLRGY
jgi:hypothetical protein